MKSISKAVIIKVFYAFLLSLLFWLLNALAGTYTSDIAVDIVYKNKSLGGKMVSNKLPETINVIYQDLGRTILWNNLKQRFNAIEIDISNDLTFIKNTNEAYINNDLILAKATSVLSPSSKLIGTDPNKIYVSFEKHSSRRIPIEIDYDLGDYMEDYNVTFSMPDDSVTITGPKVLIDGIKYWKTEIFVIESKSVAKTIILDLLKPDDPSLQLSKNQIEVNILQDQFTYDYKEVKIEMINVPSNLNARLINSIAKIEYQISLSHKSKIDFKSIRVVADFEEINFEEDQFVDLHLVKFPITMKNTKLKPNKVRFIIERND